MALPKVQVPRPLPTVPQARNATTSMRVSLSRVLRLSISSAVVVVIMFPATSSGFTFSLLQGQSLLCLVGSETQGPQRKQAVPEHHPKDVQLGPDLSAPGLP